ncbi:hypothetical protein KP509_12G080700 [Ceratopteris richardii]|uniref:Uncharacterized protein n=1 Tax=Ceratopteris richardii TaxID=49495 RepID=A0A8T2TTU4_CERRI|nr:hypothetical protein KP509_12G080700 [Ceratopteris richardii]
MCFLREPKVDGMPEKLSEGVLGAIHFYQYKATSQGTVSEIPKVSRTGCNSSILGPFLASAYQQGLEILSGWSLPRPFSASDRRYGKEKVMIFLSHKQVTNEGL